MDRKNSLISPQKKIPSEKPPTKAAFFMPFAEMHDYGTRYSHGTAVWQRPQPVAVTLYSFATAAGMVP